MTTHHATLAQGPNGWLAFVMLPGSVNNWPTHEFGTTDIPTLEARDAALAALGYEIAHPNGDSWTWTEADEHGRVVLLAGTDVRPTT